jgi:amidase
MKRIPRQDAYEYNLIIKEPKLEVRQGETFVVETEDSANGSIRREDQLPVPEVWGSASRFNPLAGPIYVQGAKPGDTLAVSIHDIVVDEQGVSCIQPGIGPLADSARYPECRGPFTKIIKHLPGPSGTTSDGRGVFNDRITWDLKPHIGTIGTVPTDPVMAGADSVYGQGPFGGNMDVSDVCRGHKILLPIYHEGAYLYAGDVHGSEGDAEYYGMADESRAEVTLSCDVVAGKQIPAPRIETPTSLIQLHSSRPVEDAVHQAFLWLMDWLVTDYSISPRDAYLLMCLNPDVRIHVYQMVNMGRIGFTVGVEFPKKYLV